MCETKSQQHCLLKIRVEKHYKTRSYSVEKRYFHEFFCHRSVTVNFRNFHAVDHPKSKFPWNQLFNNDFFGIIVDLTENVDRVIL